MRSPIGLVFDLTEPSQKLSGLDRAEQSLLTWHDKIALVGIGTIAHGSSE